MKKKGFITLYIVIITGFIATGLLFMFSMDSFLSVKSSLNAKNSGGTRAMLDACAEIALETIREMNTYSGINSVMIGNNSCSYTVANTGGNNRTISASSTIKNTTRKLLITTSAFNPLHVVSWQEVE